MKGFVQVLLYSLFISRCFTLQMLPLSSTTYINNKQIQFDQRMLDGIEGSYCISLPDCLLEVCIDESTLNMDVYTDEETNPVVGLFSYAITNRHPHIQIPFCKEFSSSYSSIVSTIDSSSSTPGVEIVDWVTSCGKISIAPLPRAVIHQHNLLHRGIGVIILDKDNSVFIHQRASSKRIFPSMFDMFIGGVSASGEASVQTLIRELKEEVGLDVVAATQVSNGSGSDDTSVQFIGSTTVETTCNHCVVDCFVLKCSSTLRGSIKFADGEVQWGAWMTPEEFSTFLKEQRLNFVPDGLQVWDAMPKMLAADFHAIIEP